MATCGLIRQNCGTKGINGQVGVNLERNNIYGNVKKCLARIDDATPFASPFSVTSKGS